MSKTAPAAAATSRSKKKGANNLFAAGKTWFIAALVVAVLAAISIFVILSQVTATTTYYVLNRDVPARSQITADMLQEVITSEGGQPRNALDIGYVQVEPTFAQYALSAGDIVTASNTGALSKINEGIPEDYVVASFVAPAENSVAGKLQRGDYVDVISAGNTETNAEYVIRHALILDVAANLQNVTPEQTQTVDPETGVAESDVVRSGIPTLYTVALPPADALKLSQVSTEIGLVVLSPENFNATEGVVSPGIIPGEAGDSGAGTDPTFGLEEGTEGVAPAPAATEAPAPAETSSN